MHVAVSMYAVALLAAMLTATALVWLRRPTEKMGWVCGVVALGALLGARAVAVVLHAGDDVPPLEGALSSSGAIAGGLAALAAAARVQRVRVATLLDAVAPAALVALAIGRIGCFLAGCCYGRPTALPWGVVLPLLGEPARHPVQLYEAAALLALATLVARRSSLAAATRDAAIGYASVRIFIEFLRDPTATDRLGPVPLAPALALALATVAALASHRRHGPKRGAGVTVPRLRTITPIVYASPVPPRPTTQSHGGIARMAVDEKFKEAFKEVTVHSGHREMSVEDIATIQPGLGRIMPDIGTRTWKLFYAAKAGNWPLAKFQWKEIRGLMELGSFTRPKYEQNLADFMEQQWKPIEEAIAKEDFALFEKRFHEAVAQGNAYHELRDKPYLRWKLPDAPPPDLDLTPRKK